jgi:hypothetical protein
MSLEARIADEVRALGNLDLEGLRADWRRRYGPPPTLRSPALLAMMLAWRIQTEAFGGLDPDLARRLRRGVGLGTAKLAFPSGARLSREWRGERHDVEVAADGFRYRGETYRSLSRIAAIITGVKWNGRRFFGLDKETAG